MDWILLIMGILILSPFILMWFMICIAVWKELGWQAGLRLSLVILPMIIVIGLATYGWGLLSGKSRDIMMGVLCVTSSLVAWRYILMYPLGMVQGQELWVDSKPPDFIEVSGVKINALVLVFGVFALINAGLQLEDTLEASSRIMAEGLKLLMSLSLAVMLIVQAFRRFQIRQNGIITNWGRLLRWNAIVKYNWVKYQDKVELEIRRWPLRNRTVVLHVPPEHRAILGEYLIQCVGEPA